MMLDLREVTVEYGATKALDGVSLHLGEGRVGVILGANGAGKSTLIRSISGLARLSSGSVAVSGVAVTRVPPHKRPGLGVSHVMEGHRCFPRLTVEENLLIGDLPHYKKRRTRGAARQAADAQYARFPPLAARRTQLAGTLSGGEQQMLAVAVALMSRPTLLLLDEPSLGLAPKIVDLIFSLVIELRDEGLTVLLAEQMAELAIEVADDVWLLRHGRVVRSGEGASLRGAAEEIISAYLTG